MNETRPIASDAPRRSRKSSGSTSAPARKVRTIEAKLAMNTSQSVFGVQVEHVAGEDAEPELEQRDRDPDLDRDHARGDDSHSQDGGELDGAHDADRPAGVARAMRSFTGASIRRRVTGIEAISGSTAVMERASSLCRRSSVTTAAVVIGRGAPGG